MSEKNPWLTKEIDFNDAASPEDKLHFLIRYAVLAPSGHNTQPWIFKINSGQIKLYADRTRCLPVVDPYDRALIISCGAALGMLEVALRYFGYVGKIDILPDKDDNDYLACISLGERHTRTEQDEKLFHAIQKRRTNRRKFDSDRLLPSSLQEECCKAAKSNGAQLILTTKEKSTLDKQVAALVAEGDRQQFSDVRFRRELASWIHSLRSSSHDGMAPYSMGLPMTLDPVAPFMSMILRRFDVGNGRAAADEDLAVHSSALGLLATPEDTAKDWLMAGRALAYILLELTAQGATAGYLNQPVEVPELRTTLAKVLGINGHPQILMRMGYGPEIEPSARRPVSEVVQFV